VFSVVSPQKRDRGEFQGAAGLALSTLLTSLLLSLSAYLRTRYLTSFTEGSSKGIPTQLPHLCKTGPEGDLRPLSHPIYCSQTSIIPLSYQRRTRKDKSTQISPSCRTVLSTAAPRAPPPATKRPSCIPHPRLLLRLC
jgi:hypothetical protein